MQDGGAASIPHKDHEDVREVENVMESNEETLGKAIAMDSEMKQCSECEQYSGEEWITCGKCWRSYHGDCLRHMTTEQKEKAKDQYWSCHKCALWQRTSEKDMKSFKEKVETINDYVMVPPKMEITDEFKAELINQARAIVQANSEQIDNGIQRLEQYFEQKISVMESNFKKELEEIRQSINTTDRDMWKNKFDQVNQQLSDTRRNEKQLNDELTKAKLQIQRMTANQSHKDTEEEQQPLLERRISHEPMNVEEDIYTGDSDAQRIQSNVSQRENLPSLLVTWSDVMKRSIQHTLPQSPRKTWPNITRSTERKETITQASGSTKSYESRNINENVYGAVGPHPDETLLKRVITSHDQPSEGQGNRNITYDILRDLRNKDNEQRAKQRTTETPSEMRNENRNRQRMRDMPTQMRKRSRSMSRERDRRVRFKWDIAKTKVQVISDSQLKFVVVDEELKELWIRKCWDNYVALMRGLNASDIKHLIEKKHINTTESDIIILSAGSNDLQYYINQDQIRKHEDPNEIRKENAKLIQDIAKDITSIAQRLVREGKTVYWISPPLHSRRDEQGYIDLEETVSTMASSIPDFCVINLAGRMVKEIMKQENRKEVMNTFMGEEDTNHLNKNMTRRILLDIVTQYEKCELVEGVKVSDILSREELLNSIASCWACGSSAHETRDYRRREELRCECCVRNGHSTKVCIWQLRMCHYCGLKGPHKRKKCEGWWNKLQNWRRKWCTVELKLE